MKIRQQQEVGQTWRSACASSVRPIQTTEDQCCLPVREVPRKDNEARRKLRRRRRVLRTSKFVANDGELCVDGGEDCRLQRRRAGSSANGCRSLRHRFVTGRAAAAAAIEAVWRRRHDIARRLVVASRSWQRPHLVTSCTRRIRR